MQCDYLANPTVKHSDETCVCVRCWSLMQAAERGNSICEKRGDGGANQSKSVKETPRPRERQSCSASGDKTEEKMKMYSQADAINQE